MGENSIFYSDDQEPKQDNKNEFFEKNSYVLQDPDLYITSVLDSKIFCLDIDHASQPQPNSSKTNKNVKLSRKCKTDQDTEPIQNENFLKNRWGKNRDSQFIPKKMNRPTKSKSKKKKKRNSDQNICKKCHTFANKCLRDLKVYKYISPFIEKIHKRNYFIIALIIAQKCNKLDDFIKKYTEKAAQKISQCETDLKNSLNGSNQYKKKKQMLKAIKSSLQAIYSYKNNSMQDAVYKLYDIEKMKRQAWVQQAYAQILQINKTIQIN